MSKELADVLRKAILDSGLSANELSKRTGVPQTTISAFIRGLDLRLSTAQKIAAYLGLELKRKS